MANSFTFLRVFEGHRTLLLSRVNPGVLPSDAVVTADSRLQLLAPWMIIRTSTRLGAPVWLLSESQLRLVLSGSLIFQSVDVRAKTWPRIRLTLPVYSRVLNLTVQSGLQVMKYDSVAHFVRAIRAVLD